MSKRLRRTLRNSRRRDEWFAQKNWTELKEKDNEQQNNEKAYYVLAEGREQKDQSKEVRGKQSYKNKEEKQENPKKKPKKKQEEMRKLKTF